MLPQILITLTLHAAEREFRGAVMLTAGTPPKAIAVGVEIDGKPAAALWGEAVAALFRYADLNGDGSLDAKELRFLPSPYSLRQQVWGVFRFDGPAPDMKDINVGGKVGLAEVESYYRRKDLGPVLVASGRPPGTDRLSAALVKHLDADGDGTVTEAELGRAEQSLSKLDRNADELISADELVYQISYPGAHASKLIPNSASGPAADRSAGVFDLRVGDVTLETGSGQPATGCLIALGRTIRSEGPTTTPFTDRLTPDGRWVTAACGDTAVHLRADEGRLGQTFPAHRKKLDFLFAQADSAAKGRIDAKGVESPDFADLALLIPYADRNGDGAVVREELAAYRGLLEKFAFGVTLITVLDHDRGLFEVADGDHDGKLSVRELRSLAVRLKAAGAVRNGVLDTMKLPRTLLVCVARGHPREMLAKRSASGPEWFRAMDRNGDGEVSLREWHGSQAEFVKLDVDGDGLLSASEAGGSEKK